MSCLNFTKLIKVPFVGMEEKEVFGLLLDSTPASAWPSCLLFSTPLLPTCSHDISRTPPFVNLLLFSLNSLHSAHLCLNFLDCPHAFRLLSYTASCQHHLLSVTLQLSLSPPFSSSPVDLTCLFNLNSRSFSEILRSLRDKTVSI